MGGVVALVGLTVAVGKAAELVNLTTLTRDGQGLVSFELAGAFTDDVRSTIESGSLDDLPRRCAAQAVSSVLARQDDSVWDSGDHCPFR